jgi:antitoxin (DNA-binding transcriptional repressor) of toxin-antitoxin stability system
MGSVIGPDIMHEPEYGEFAMTILSLEDVQARLPDLIHSMSAGSEVVITERNVPVARLVMAEKAQPIAGRGKGTITILCEDNEHLEDFEDYKP